jgi:8-demethyl-8-alpha-L-rhamnosyltetracenomycin-C 2'-O-methyltransferase
MSLDQIAERYVLDKHASMGRHNYIPAYTKHFAPIRTKSLSILEIGIGIVETGNMMHVKWMGYRTGNSLRCWRDFFPNAMVHGVDLYDVREIIGNEDRIQTHVANQASEAELVRVVQTIGQPLDIVIDDGSHDRDHQVFSFTVLAKHLASEGMYVIEDIQPPYQEAFADLSVFTPDVQEFIRENFDVAVHDTREGFSEDDFMMVFTRR